MCFLRVADQALVAVAASHVSFAGTVPTYLITWSSHHNDPMRVTIASWIHTHTEMIYIYIPNLRCNLASFINVQEKSYIHSQPRGLFWLSPK